MPIANGFLTPDEFADEFFFELGAALCESCGMVQLTETVDAQRLFHDQYAFYSSTSAVMEDHFRKLAKTVLGRREKDPLVVEIGSNDGIFLRHVAGADVRHLGIEPSANVAAAARSRGVRTIERFFDASLAEEIVETDGQAQFVVAANVMCHMPDLHSVIEGVSKLLSREGSLIFEDPYVGEIVTKTAYDQIYDEHVFYFSMTSLAHLLAQHGLEIYDAEAQSVHGGSMRYYAGHRDRHPVSDRVSALQQRERDARLDHLETFVGFRERVETSREQLMHLLTDLALRKQRVVGYGATSKSTTVINYCGITPDLVEFMSDTTPIKQGKYSPGMHIPIRSPLEFEKRFPDYALLFAWNHKDEVLAKNKGFIEAGGRWILYVPSVYVTG